MHVFPPYSSCKCHQYWTCIKIQPSLLCKSSSMLWLACVVAMAQSVKADQVESFIVFPSMAENGSKTSRQEHPRQTRALCTLGRFSASSLQAFNLSIKVWSRQHKDLRINTLAKVPGWGLAEPHGRLHMSEKYVSKLYTLHFVSWFPFRFLQTMTFLRKVGRVQRLGITNFSQ